MCLMEREAWNSSPYLQARSIDLKYLEAIARPVHCLHYLESNNSLPPPPHLYRVCVGR